MGYIILLIIIGILIFKQTKNKKEKEIPTTNLYTDLINENVKENKCKVNETIDNEVVENKTQKQYENIETLESSFEKKEYLFTRNELKFYKQLKKITDNLNLTIFAQVSLYQIIKNKEFKDFNRIRSKSIDFVITENNGKIRMCIELDDSTHNHHNRIERDVFLNNIFKEANIKLLRIPVQDFYNLEYLQKQITEN